ncbi:hypothetical protein TNCV_860201 [Trichonephila clavipes]|nr:hypothetical protein TNCV_860201 [Trichonephila clavipes]
MRDILRRFQSLGRGGVSFRSRLGFKKILIRIILIAKSYSRAYPPKNYEFRGVCELATVARLHHYVMSVVRVHA